MILITQLLCFSQRSKFTTSLEKYACFIFLMQPTLTPDTFFANETPSFIHYFYHLFFWFFLAFHVYATIHWSGRDLPFLNSSQPLHDPT